MPVRFDREKYRQRWQVETIFSMIKPNPGSATVGRSYWSRRRDMMRMALTHNIMILCPSIPFYQAGQELYHCPLQNPSLNAMASFVLAIAGDLHLREAGFGNGKPKRGQQRRRNSSH